MYSAIKSILSINVTIILIYFLFIKTQFSELKNNINTALSTHIHGNTSKYSPLVNAK